MISSSLLRRKSFRSLGFETLEQRELLSVSPLNFPKVSQPVYQESNWFEQIAGQEMTIPTGGESSGIVENEWVVQLNDEWVTTLPSVFAAADFFEPYGITVLGGLGLEGALHVRVEGETVQEQADVFETLSCFEFWEPNYFIQSSAGVGDVVDDAYVGEQWWLDLINVLPAWEETKGEDVVVAVVDSGIGVNHPDLYSSLWVNQEEIAGNGIDDDGNGFIDDYHGWNFGTTVGYVYDGVGDNNLTDTYGHGVHVAGIIAATENETGIVGIAPEAKIMAIKTDYYGWMTLSTVSNGISYAIKMKEEFGVNIRVLNASFSSSSNMLLKLMQKAGEEDIVVVAAAGNEAVDIDLGKYYPAYAQYPANNSDLANVITVAATNENDQLALFSNYGAEMVSLAAPGNDILSTYLGTGHAYMSGTSMAAPMVSAAVALIASARPDLDAATIKRIICENVDIITDLEGKVLSGGRLNVGRAVQMAVAPENRPSAPNGFTVTQRDEDLTFLLQWNDVSNEAGYEIQMSTDNGATWTTLKKLNADTASDVYTPKEITNYRFRIRAYNHYGNSAWSAEVSRNFVLPDKLPATRLYSLQYGLSTNYIGLSWTRILGATGYRIERSVNSPDAWEILFSGDVVPGKEGYNDYDIDFSNDYYYRITTIHGDVLSDPSNVVTNVLPPPPAAAPTPMVLKTGPTSVELIFDAMPDCFRYSILRYNEKTKEWDHIAAVYTGYFLDTNLKYETTYRYQVIGVGSGGISPPSTVVSATTLGPPPTAIPVKSITLAVRDWSTAEISWKPTQGALAYRVERSDTWTNSWITLPLSNATATGGTITGLLSSQSYTLRVVAINGSGETASGNVYLNRRESYAPYESPSELCVLDRTDTTVRLQWKSVYAMRDLSYIVERSTDGATWKKAGTVKVASPISQEATTEYTDKGLKASTQYHYRVYATTKWGIDSATTFPSEVLSTATMLSSKIAPTVKVDTKNITIIGARNLTITPPKNSPSGLHYYIEYTSAVDAKKKPDWSQSTIEKVSGSTHDLGTILTPGTQYFVRVVATETNYALDALPAWHELESVAVGKETKFKTKAVPLAKITTSGYAISPDGEYGVKLRITTPQQNDNKKNPVLPTGTTFSYQLIVAGDKAKTDKATGLLIGGDGIPIQSGTVTFLETAVKNKTFSDSSVIPFSDLSRIGNLKSMKNVQVQLLVTYIDPGTNTPIAAVATKVAKLTLPKWYA